MKRQKLVCLLVCLALLFTTPALRADAVTDWNAITFETLAAAGVRRVPPATRTLAMVHAAIYDAVNSIEHRYSPYLVRECAPKGALPYAAAVLAAYTVLLNIYPDQKLALDTALAKSLSEIPDSPSKALGAAWGTAVGSRFVSLRSNDGSAQSIAYMEPPAPGVWRPTPPDFTPGVLVAWAQVTPFALLSGSQFRALPPPSIYKTRFRRDLDEVKALGSLNSTVRTPEQTEIALFWAENSDVTWNHIAVIVAEQRSRSLISNARLFALLNLSEADGSIIAFDTKYTYNFWRPITAIQEGVINGRHTIPPDPSWLPLVSPTPAHPDYTSQHAILGSASANVLAFFFGTDRIPFTVTSSSGVARHFDSFSQAAEENAHSRIYIGYHFRTAVERGLRQGKDLGDWVCDNFLTNDDDDDR